MLLKFCIILMCALGSQFSFLVGSCNIDAIARHWELICPHPCDCEPSTDHIKCSTNGTLTLKLNNCHLNLLPIIPLDIGNITEALLLNGNDINVLPSRWMKNLTNLVRLEISDTLPCYNQSMISDDIFYGPKALTVLHIVESIKCTRSKDSTTFPVSVTDAERLSTLVELHMTGLTNLTFLAHLSSLKILNLGSANCRIASTSTLAPLQNVSVERLSLRNCTNFNRGDLQTFANATHSLVYLDLSCLKQYGKYDFVLQIVTDALPKNSLRVLIIDHTQTMLLQSQSCPESLASTQLTTFSFRLNKFQWGHDSFGCRNLSHFFPVLQGLDISQSYVGVNNLDKLINSNSEYGLYLCWLKASAVVSVSPFQTCPERTSLLFMSETAHVPRPVTKLSSPPEQMLLSMVKLIIDGNHQILDRNYSSNSSLEYLDMSNYDKSVVQVPEVSHGLSRLQTIKCHNCKFVEHFTLEYIFKSYPGIENLLLRGSTFQTLESRVVPENLTVLDLQSVSIEKNQRVRLGTLPSLRFLNLSKNKITTWNIELQTVPRLKSLDMSFNEISYIDSNVTELISEHYTQREGDFKLSLLSNPILCSCEESVIQFLLWLNQSDFVKYDTKCVNSPLEISAWLETECQSIPPVMTATIVYVSVAIGLVLVFVGVGAFVVYKQYHIRIRIWYYLKFKLKPSNLRPHHDGDKVVYLAFCTENTHQYNMAFSLYWYLVNHPELRLIPRSQFDLFDSPTDFRNGAIFDYIQESSYQILLLPNSEYFHGDTWELHASLEEDPQIRRIIPVIGDEELGCHFGSTLDGILKDRSQRLYPPDSSDASMEMFWQSIKNFIQEQDDQNVDTMI